MTLPSPHPLRLALHTLKTAFLAHFAFTQFLQLSHVHGPSMLPTFGLDGTWLLIDMSARRGRRLQRGDLVIYKIPIDSHDDGLKRLVGLPGDYVCANTPGLPGEDVMIQVPEGHCWIVGDNLPTSRDSRHYGPLPLALVKGKAIAQILPWAERQWITNNLERVE